MKMAEPIMLVNPRTETPAKNSKSGMNSDYLGRLPKNLSFVDAAPILCAGVTTYKGLKMTEARPGE
jgi:NADPH:quinone reductase-like Zn-dependent oxidoreductase